MKKILISADVIDPRCYTQGDEIHASDYLPGGPNGVHRVVRADEHGVHVVKKTCLACTYCALDPSDDFYCAHPDTQTPFGEYLHRATAEDGHCGPTMEKFEQHQYRNMDGSLKGS